MKTLVRRIASQPSTISTRVAMYAVLASLAVSSHFAIAQEYASLAIYAPGDDPSSFSVEPFTFNDSSRWSSTATSGGGLGQGDPTTITWSIVPDGTPITPAGGGIPSTESSASSTLIAQLNSNFGIAPGPTQGQAWFAAFNTSFNRFAELSGLSYTYEPNDDGQNIRSGFPGVLGTRADVRIGGHPIDGNSGANILAYNYFPNLGNMVLDTDNTGFYSVNNTSFRNIVMHEHGHGLGLNHTNPVNQTKLLESIITGAFEGPQIDDIQAIHRGYGDFYEKSNGGAGNEVSGNATPLGVVADTTVSIGTDGADTGSNFEVFPNESDFISIDDSSDIDFLSFTLTSLSSVDLGITPVGGAYNSGPQGNTPALFNATAQSDLTLVLFDSSLTSLVTANNTGLGGSESITNQLLAPGNYFARVTGAANATQLYQLDVSAVTVPEPISATLVFVAALVGISFCRRERS